MDKKPLIFVSHSNDDAQEVSNIITYLKNSFQSVDFFVSSSFYSIQTGSIWFEEIRDNLFNCQLVLTCLSRNSIKKPWVIFESGAGFGRGIKLLPLIIDDLPLSALEDNPLFLLQVLQLENYGMQRLIKKMGDLLKLNPDINWINNEKFNTINPITNVLAQKPGVYISGTKFDIFNGWVRYTGSGDNFLINRNSITIGKSFDDGFRYPPNDSLNAPWKYWGFRIRPKNNIWIYAVIKNLNDETEKILVSSQGSNWGYIANPKDEFVIPISKMGKDKWCNIFVDLKSIEIDLRSPIKSIIGFKARGPLELSHIWCLNNINEIPDTVKNDYKLISYPR